MNQSRVPEGVPTGGQFAAAMRGEAEVHLSSTSSTYDAPLSAAEFGIAADKAQEMARMEADGLVGLPDGSNVELIASEADDAVVGDIVEVGTYVRTFPDQTSLIYGFSNLSKRADAHDSIAFEAVRRSREQAATGSDGLPDPWGDEEPLAASVRGEFDATLDDNGDCGPSAEERELSEAHDNGVHDDEPPYPGCPGCDRRIAHLQDMAKAIHKGE